MATDFSTLPPPGLTLHPSSLHLEDPTPFAPAPAQLSLTPASLAALQSHLLAAERARQASEERTRARIKAHGFRLALMVGLLHAPIDALDDSGTAKTGRGPLNWIFLPPPLVFAPEIMEMNSMGEEDRASLKVDCVKAKDVMRRIEATFASEGRADDMRFLCRGVRGWVAKTTHCAALVNISALLLGSHPRLLTAFSSTFLPPTLILTSRPLSSTTLPPCPQSELNNRKADVESLDPLFERLSCVEIKDIARRSGVELHEGENQHQPEIQLPADSDQMDCDPLPCAAAQVDSGMEAQGEDLVDRDEDAEWWAVTYAGAVATAMTRVRRRGHR